MSLSSIQLDAFFEVAKTGSFSKASQLLCITQSALSQRVINLEEYFETTLFIRGTKGISLTDSGTKLLRYCQSRDQLEKEVVENIKSNDVEISGVLRVAGYSTINRSIVSSAVFQILADHSSIQVEILTKELYELQQILETGATDFLLTSAPIKKQGIISEQIGSEKYVLISSSRSQKLKNVYLDHDKDDSITYDFFQVQKSPKKTFKRIFFDEIYSIIEAVESGIGQAVVPKHLIIDNSKVKVLKGYKELVIPVFINFLDQPFYTKLHNLALSKIKTQAAKVLT